MRETAGIATRLWVTSPAPGGHAIDRLDLETGASARWAVVAPQNPLGLLYVAPPVVAANGSRYALSYLRVVSNLYVIEGLA